MIIRYLVLLAVLFSHASFAGFTKDIVSAALERTNHEVQYDGSYLVIKYPGGDVAKNIGVCTDVVIRSYRALGVDLQVLVQSNFPQEQNQVLTSPSFLEHHIDTRAC